MTFDVGIENGTLIRPSGRLQAHLYFRAGRIAAITSERLSASRVLDAGGLFVMPGMVDTHVHLMDPGDTSREDFPSGTAAAAAAGVTTIIEHTHSAPIRTSDDLADKRAYLANRSLVDFGLAAHVWPEDIDHVERLWNAGVAFFKVFTCETHGVPALDAAQLRRLFQHIAACGAVSLVHCEDDAITRDQERIVRQSGRTDGGVVREWRHPDAELVALRLVTDLANRTGAQIIAAHLSSADAVTAIQREGAPGQVLGETCPQYLTLLANEIDTEGAFRKFTPPARAQGEGDLNAMWAALAQGQIHHVSSDHAPSTPEQKTSGSIFDVHFGLPGLDTTMAVLLDGAAAGRISYERLVAVYSEAPARAYRLRRKGRLEVGTDADVVLVDPTIEWTITRDAIRSRAGWSPFEGRQIRGKPIATFRRGVQIFGEHASVAPGSGEFLPGAGTAETSGSS